MLRVYLCYPRGCDLLVIRLGSRLAYGILFIYLFLLYRESKAKGIRGFDVVAHSRNFHKTKRHIMHNINSFC